MLRTVLTVAVLWIVVSVVGLAVWTLVCGWLREGRKGRP